MKNNIRTGILLFFLGTSTVIASPCPGPQCSPQPIWAMTNPTQASYDNHGQGWIYCDPSKSIQFENQTLIVKYDHSPGDIERTCYARFNLANYFQRPDFQSHGYITATIRTVGTQAPDFLKQHIWPAFWVRGVGAWPVNGEIDLFEYMAQVQKNITHVNLHGGPAPNQDVPKSEVVTYKVPALEDIGVSHVYGMEWQKDASNGYLLTFYIDNVNQGNYYAISSAGMLDAAIVRGFSAGMQMIFDADDIGSNLTPNSESVKKLPQLNYQLEITNVKAYTYING